LLSCRATVSAAFALLPGIASTSPGNASAARGLNSTGYITIAGGVKLAYDLTLPAAHGRFPVALEYNDYTAGANNSAETAGSDADALLAAGFAILGVNQPGSGCSGGVNDITNVSRWGKAGAEVVEWATGQPWSSGHVGMFGSSWTGITQLGVASFRPKGLDAITPFQIATDFYRDVAYPGGVYDERFMKLYAEDLVSIDARAAAREMKRGTRQCVSDYRAALGPNKEYSIGTNSVANPFYDDYWKTSPIEFISRIDLPLLGCQSWQDGLVGPRSTELYYNTFRPKTTWFIGLNGPHGICEMPQPLAMLVKFFRHYVAGVDNGWQKTPHITLFDTVGGGTQWKNTYKGWSQVMKPLALYFQGNRSLNLKPVKAVAAKSSFSGPAASQSGRWSARPKTGTWVSYTTPPLTHALDFFGPGSVNLWLSSTARDTDIEVVLSEVRPGGQEQYVQAGWLDVAKRKLAPAGNGPYESTVLRPYQLFAETAYEPLVPGHPVYARVELLPFEHLFPKGSSIRLTIDSAMGAVQSTGDWGLTGSTTKFRDTIYVGPTQRSDVVLGLIPGARAWAPPACKDILGEPCRPNRVPVPSGHLAVPEPSR
jgi:uncharacterized protein